MSGIHLFLKTRIPTIPIVKNIKKKIIIPIM